jgi:ATP-dependent RNA helicase SUPV3L1/SUV3
MSISGLSEVASSGRRNVVAVLGPTNTGKTHLAIERMLAHSSGVIGLPLRLLAREVYNRVAERAGAQSVALITGEEKIIPPSPRYRVCTVEAMPDATDASFLAIDEIQLAGDLERGHVFTDRMLNLRGRDETLLLGATTMRGIVERLIPGVNVVTRPRMSLLTYSGSKKITRLPQRSAVVAFSADEVYAIAELIRRQRGGAAVVLGSLSPRTRNAQVELFQSGDVDFLVATDAIGMGLNLNVDHVAFAGDRKFDGYQYRRLTPAEFAQIAGRAGRHMRDGTFGVTGRAEPFEDTLIEALESHTFEPVKVVQWRNRDLDFSSLANLKASLDLAPGTLGLTKAPPSVDVDTLDRVARDDAVAALADRRERVALLWDVCQVPDYRRIAPANHAELVATLFSFITRDGVISEDWLASQVAFADHVDGDIDTLANRIAHIRTWTFAANRPQWLKDPLHWQERTRAVEDRLSDALHERLTARFVDRRTSVLMRRLKENAMLEAEITPTGDVMVEGQHVGSLDGFRFAADPNATDGPEAKALRAVAQKALAGEIQSRAEKVASAANGDFVLAFDGMVRWQGAAIARIIEGDDALRPRLLLLADEQLAAPAREQVQARLDLWLTNHIGTLLKPLVDLRAAETLTPVARGLAFRLSENFGIVERSAIAEEVKSLDQDARAGLRAMGVRFGAHHLCVPALLKPAPTALIVMLWALKNGGLGVPGLAELARLASSGRTSVTIDAAFTRQLYPIVGYKICGTRAVRVDILERLADIIRPLIAWRPTAEQPNPPPGAINGYGFTTTVAMTSLLGCAGDDFAGVLRALGYRMDRRPAPAPVATPKTAAEAPANPTESTPEGAPTTPIMSPTTPVEELASAGVEAVTSPEAEAVVPLEADAGVEAVAAEAAAPTEAVASAPEVVAAPEAADTTEVATPAEPQFIEVWRPGGQRDRGERGRPPRREGQGRHERRPAQASTEATPAAAAAAAPGDAAAATAEPARGRGPWRGDGGRKGRAEGAPGERDEGRKGPPRDRDRGARRRGRPGEDGEDSRRGRDQHARPDARREPMRFSTEPAKGDKRAEIDPTSPFAALAQLKARLEGKDG